MKEENSIKPKTALIGISIVLISYKHDEYFRDAIDSVLNQNYDRSKIELIVVCKSNGIPISYLEKLPINIDLKLIISDDFRIGPKFKQAVEKAKYEWIAVIDDDDMWHPDKLKVISSYIEKDRTLRYIHNSKVYVNEKYSFNQLKKDAESSVNDAKNENLLERRRKSIVDCEHNESSIIFKKSIVMEDLEVLSRLEGALDTFLYLCAKGQGLNILCLREKMTYFRVNGVKIGSSQNFNLTGNLSRQLKSYQALYNLQHHTPCSLMIIDRRVTTNQIKLTLLSEMKISRQSRVFLTKNCLKTKLFANFEGFFLTWLSIISVLSVNIASRMYSAIIERRG